MQPNDLNSPNGPASFPVESAVPPAAHATFAWLRDIAVAGIVSLFIILFLYQPVRVEGTSMVPMLQDQDRLCINKLAYHVGQHSPVAMLSYSATRRDLTRSYIKRVIGLTLGIVFASSTAGCSGMTRALTEVYVPARYADERSEPEDDRRSADDYLHDGRPSLRFL